MFKENAPVVTLLTFLVRAFSFADLSMPSEMATSRKVAFSGYGSFISVLDLSRRTQCLM